MDEDNEGAGWEQQMENEQRRQEEDRAHRKAAREAWQRWADQGQPKEKEHEQV